MTDLTKIKNIIREELVHAAFFAPFYDEKYGGGVEPHKDKYVDRLVIKLLDYIYIYTAERNGFVHGKRI